MFTLNVQNMVTSHYICTKFYLISFGGFGEHMFRQKEKQLRE